MENGPFSDDASGQISSKYVAVRLTGGRDITPEVTDFMKKYGVRGYPTMFIMNKDGEIVNAKVGRTVDGILEALAKGEKNEIEFAEVSKATDAKGRTRLAAILAERRKFDEAIKLFKELEAEAPSLEIHEGLAKAYGASGDGAAEIALIEKMVGLYKDAEERPQWRITIATKDLRSLRSREEAMEKFPLAAANLEKLLAEVQAEKDTKSEPAVRVELGNLLSHPFIKKPDEARVQFDAVIANFPESKQAPTALMGRANSFWREENYAGCITELERILEKYPDSDEAKMAPGGITNCKKRIEAKGGK